MGNPTCPKDGALMMTKSFERDVEKGGLEKLFGFVIGMNKDRVGRSKYWACPKCGARFKKGGAVIGGKY